MHCNMRTVFFIFIKWQKETHPPFHLHPLSPEANLTHVVLKRVDHQVVPAVGAKLRASRVQKIDDYEQIRTS